MAFNINEILANLKYGGARPTLFQVTISNPVDPVADIKTPFLVETAQLPTSTISPIQVFYFGRAAKIPGDREFEPWTVTVINDEDFAVRHQLEKWHQAINQMHANTAALGSDPSIYKSQATVTQYGKNGEELRVYQFNGIWPSSIAAIELSWQSQNEIERYQVTFEFDTYEVVGGNTGTVGNE